MKLSKSVLLGAVSGVLILIIWKTLRLDLNILMLAAGIFVLCVVLISLIQTVPYNKRVKEQSKLLQEGRAEEALESMKKLHEKTLRRKNKPMERLLRLNMTAAYIDLEQYDEAMEIFETLSPKGFSGVGLFAYYNNLCSCYLYRNEDEKFLQTYHQNEELFRKYSRHRQYGENAVILEAFVQLMEGNAEKAEALLNSIKENRNTPKSQKDIDRIERRLNELKALR